MASGDRRSQERLHGERWGAVKKVKKYSKYPGCTCNPRSGIHSPNCEFRPENKNTETLLYGLPKGGSEEVCLLSNATPEKIERVKELATRDGFHSFRVAVMNLDFGNMVEAFGGKL
jgi:hypothetical protein